MGEGTFEAGALEEEREWTVEGFPVLRAKASLPDPSGLGRARRLYRVQARAFWGLCAGELLPWMEAEGRASLEAGRPPRCARASLTWRETYREGRLWSLWTVLEEDAAPGPASAIRWGDTWDLEEGIPLPLGRMFPARTPWRRRILETAEADLGRREEAGAVRLIPGWRRALRRCFDPKDWYLTGAGIAVWWPMWSLGPAGLGTPTVVLPWEDGPLSAPLR